MVFQFSISVLTWSVAVISSTVDLNMARISPKNCSGNRLFLVQKNLSVFSRCCDMLLNCQYNEQTNSQVENALVPKISKLYYTRYLLNEVGDPHFYLHFWQKIDISDSVLKCPWLDLYHKLTKHRDHVINSYVKANLNVEKYTVTSNYNISLFAFKINLKIKYNSGI